MRQTRIEAPRGRAKLLARLEKLYKITVLRRL
jgi:hypothetical protein